MALAQQSDHDSLQNAHYADLGRTLFRFSVHAHWNSRTLSRARQLERCCLPTDVMTHSVSGPNLPGACVSSAPASPKLRRESALPRRQAGQTCLFLRRLWCLRHSAAASVSVIASCVSLALGLAGCGGGSWW